MASTRRGKNIINCQLLTCNCRETLSIDAKKMAGNLGLAEVPETYSDLCRSQLSEFEKSLAQNDGQKLVITCTQEAPLFSELAQDYDDVELEFVNIREAAGWSKPGAKADAKIAALIAGELYEVEPTGLLPVASDGSCIVYGGGQKAFDVAEKLSARLSVSLILTSAADVIVSSATTFPIHSGIISKMTGSIGQFTLMVDGYSSADPSSRDHLDFQEPRNGIELSTALLFDLSGGDPLLGGAHGRDGYINVDADNPLQIAEAMYDITDLVGEFEKPLFVSLDPAICAHSRNGQTGCSNCIDSCPTSAITSSGDSVQVTADICDGCGHCSSSCPTGAIAYAYPNRADLITRCQIMVSTYLSAGGKNPVLLIHEQEHGTGLIAAMARFGNGLGENVIPVSVHSIAHLGHDAFAALFAGGVQSIALLAPLKNRTTLAAVEFQIKLTNTFMSNMGFDDAACVQLIIEDDPDNVATALEAIGKLKMPPPKSITASKNKRETARLALQNLNSMTPNVLEVMDLPENAPYGQILIDKNSCTLCLACVGACPAGALGDNENRPLVSFTEQACVQCGLCRVTCPENAISLQPRYNFDKSALSPIVLNEDEPLECIKCGKPFGSKSAVNKVISILEGKNPMFQTSEQVSLIKMCDNCRVITMAENQSDPMAMGTVPRTLTAADILPEDEEPTKH